MVYRNKRTGAVIDSPCVIQGGNWEELKQPKVKTKKDDKKKAANKKTPNKKESKK